MPHSSHKYSRVGHKIKTAKTKSKHDAKKHIAYWPSIANCLLGYAKIECSAKLESSKGISIKTCTLISTTMGHESEYGVKSHFIQYIK